VLLPNRRIPTVALAAMIEEQFPGLSGPLRFVPVGEDSWCFRAGGLWVSVRQDREGHRPAAYEAACELRDGGLEFVLAPLAGRDGLVVHTVGGFPVVVSPFLEGGPATGPAAGCRVAAMMTRLHRATVAAEIPVEDFAFPFGIELATSVSRIVDEGAARGPFADPLRCIVACRRDAIAQLQDDLCVAGEACRRSDLDMVVTHGDPVAHNALRHRDRLLLVDWTGVAWAPRERDWFFVRTSFGPRAIGAGLRPEALRFYGLRFALMEIEEYLAHFLGERAGSVEDAPAWRKLLLFLPPAGDAG